MQKNIDWQDSIFAIILFIATGINFITVMQYKQLPSPIYGGDHYHHLGIVYHILYGGGIFEHPQLLGEQPWVPPLYHLVVATLSIITGLEPAKVGAYLTTISIFFTALIAYIFGNILFKDKLFGLILAVTVLILISGLYYMKYTVFAMYIVMPLFFLSFFVYLKKKDITSSIFVGLMLGIAGLTHMQAYISAFVFLFVFCVYNYLLKWIRIEGRTIHIENIKSSIANDWINLLVIFVIGFVVSLPFWFKPLFVFRGSSFNKLPYYGWPDFSQTFIQIAVAFSDFTNNFFDIRALASGDYFHFIFSVIALGGLVACFKRNEKTIEEEFLKIGSISLLVSMFHYFITIPLLKAHFGPNRLIEMHFFIPPLLFTYGLKRIKEFIPSYFIWIMLFISMLFMLGYLSILSQVEKDRWYRVGKTELPNYILEVTDWIRNNTNLNDVFLTTNEDGFVVNSFTGRKLVSYRRTHVGPFVDMNRRELDQAIILYGNDSTTMCKLLRKYNAKYLFWNVRWIQNELIFDEDGRFISYYDPLMIEYSEERERELIKNGVKYIRDKAYMDPAWYPSYPLVDVLIAVPNLNYAQPWSDEFNKHIKLIKEFKEGNFIVARIYEIDYSSFEDCIF